MYHTKDVRELEPFFMVVTEVNELSLGWEGEQEQRQKQAEEKTAAVLREEQNKGEEHDYEWDQKKWFVQD